jgi:hypothetical protein
MSQTVPWPRIAVAALSPTSAMSLALGVGAFYTASTTLRIASIACGAVVFLAMLRLSANSSMKTMAIVLLVCTLPIALVNAPTNEFRSALLPVCFAGSIGIAWFALEFRQTRLLWELPFFAYLGLTAYLIIVKQYGPGEFNDFYLGIGRNGYSAILVAVTCGYVLSCTARRRWPSHILLFLAFALSFPLYGRSSITALGLVLLTSMFARRPKLTLTLVTLGAVAYANAPSGVEALAAVDTNFKSGFDSLRWTFLQDYWEMLNPRTVFMGVDFLDLPSVRANGGSPDMAFLRLHSYVGVGSLFFAVMFATSGALLLRRGQMILLGVWAAILFRAFTDIILLFGVVDAFFVAVLFYPCFARYFPAAHATDLPTAEQPQASVGTEPRSPA